MAARHSCGDHIQQLLTVRRRVLADWVDALAEALPHAYAGGSLITTADDRSVLLDLLAPLGLVSFSLPERTPRPLASFLGLPGGMSGIGGDAARLTALSRRLVRTPAQIALEALDAAITQSAELPFLSDRGADSTCHVLEFAKSPSWRLCRLQDGARSAPSCRRARSSGSPLSPPARRARKR